MVILLYNYIQTIPGLLTFVATFEEIFSFLGFILILFLNMAKQFQFNNYMISNNCYQDLNLSIETL